MIKNKFFLKTVLLFYYYYFINYCEGIDEACMYVGVQPYDKAQMISEDNI